MDQKGQVAEADRAQSLECTAWCRAMLWQAHLVNDLLRAYAPFAYGPGKRVLLQDFHQKVTWDF